MRRAFGARRLVTTARIAAGIAHADGDDGDAGLVVERVPVEAHPFAKAIAAGVVPRDTGLVYARSGRLADDENARGDACAQHRPRAEREMLLAEAAGADFAQKLRQRAIMRGSHHPSEAKGKSGCFAPM